MLGRTLLLFWDPSISHYSMGDFEDDLREISLKYDFDPLDWGISNPKDIRQGIDFCIVKIGEGNCGIVMSGLVLSDSRYDDRNVRYCRRNYKTDCDVILGVSEMYHPDRSEIITLEQLQAALPDIPLDGSWKEFLLDEDHSRSLFELKAGFISDHPDIFEPKAGKRPALPCP